jgi:DNA-3-methyladenine glycosylase II
MQANLTFSLPVTGLFSFEECLWFLNRDFDDCMHSIEGNTVVKALSIEGRRFVLRISEDVGAVKVEVLDGKHSSASLTAIQNYVKEWFDLDRDLQPFYNLLQKQKKLAYMTEAYSGLRLVGISDLFEALCWSIIGQQINLTFAYRLKRRLVERFGAKIDLGDQSYFLFPEPHTLAAADIAELREMQYSQKKAEYVIGLAGLFEKGEMSKSLLEKIGTFAGKQQALTAIRGIGIWTANYALMKSMRVAEAIPYGDAGILQALVSHGLMKDRKDQEGMDKLFRKFKGWETYLVFYLWRSLSDKSA